MLRKLIGLSTVLTLVFGLGLSVDAGADYASNKTKIFTPIHQTVLEPGWRMSCSSDFVIENVGKDYARIEISLGRDGKIIDIINPWGKRGYNLVEKISFEKQLGKTVNIDDVALIKNSSENSRISIHC